MPMPGQAPCAERGQDERRGGQGWGSRRSSEQRIASTSLSAAAIPVWGLWGVPHPHPLQMKDMLAFDPQHLSADDIGQYMWDWMPLLQLCPCR